MQEIVDSAKLLKLTRDALRFVSFFRGTVEQAPLQIYASALLFSPAQSTVRKLFFPSDGPSWVTLHPEPDPEWNSCVHIMDARSDEVKKLVFSPSGRHLASFDDDTIMVWDALTGEMIWALGVQYGCVEDVAFAPNRNHLAIAYSGKCELWDFSTGECVGALLHSADSTVFLVAFHPTGGTLATISGSADLEIKLWDTSTCGCLKSRVVSEKLRLLSEEMPGAVQILHLSPFRF